MDTQAEAQLDGFIDRFTPDVAGLARACRARVRAILPTAIELVYDNYNALAIGFASTEKTSDCLVSVAVYPRNVSLFFYYGAGLPDPHGLLQGQGSQVRFIRLDSPAVLDDPRVLELIAEADIRARVGMPATGGGLVIKSVSAKQRPRRPDPLS